MGDITEIVAKQRAFFNGENTLPVAWRKAQLVALKSAITAHEEDLLSALKTDLNKSRFEAFATEISIVVEEINYTLKHLSKWAKPHRVKHPVTQFPGKSVRYPEPYGVTLIMSPWNYPVQLTLAPLVGAICAGNCAVVKPSNYAPATSAVMEQLISETFPEEYITVVTGGREANTALLEQCFDYIFFTGGVTVGKLVMESAAKHLTPVSLELGGKSPCIVDATTDIELVAKRVIWGKFLNAGQTCIAPDYVLVEESVKDKLVDAMQRQITGFWGSDPLKNPDLPKIITQKHFERLSALVDGSDPKNGRVIGGTRNAETRQIAPTLLVDATPDSPVMAEEIFGPVLPILAVPSFKAATAFVKERPRPLALYLFTNDKERQKYVTTAVPYGGGCINDVISHIATSEMPFGGVGNSGMGCYHGKESFTTFSHIKSVMYKANWYDLPVRYAPYTEKKLAILRTVLRQ